MDNSYRLASIYIANPIGFKEAFRSFKGETELIFDVSEAHTTLNPVVKLKIDFNDGSEVINKIYNFNQHNKIVEPIIHTFIPDKENQIIIYFPTIFIHFLDGTMFVYQCPIKIVKSSFFNDYNTLDVGNAQFIDDSSNSLFATLDTGKGDILNIKIK